MKTRQPECQEIAPVRRQGRIQSGNSGVVAATPGTGGEERLIWLGSRAGERTGLPLQGGDRQGVGSALGMMLEPNPTFEACARISYLCWLGAIAIGIMLWSVILGLI